MSVLKKCKKCKNEFQQYNNLQSLCVECAINKAKKAVKKQNAIQDKTKKKQAKNSLKTLSDYRKDARYWFQRWIRLRDVGKSCISCDTILKDIREFDAGHFYNAKSYPQLLFNEFNVSGQCRYCNDYLSGNLLKYRNGILKRYGENVLNELEQIADNKTKRTITKEEYLKITTEYKQYCKQIEK